VTVLKRLAGGMLPPAWYTRLKYAPAHARHFGLARHCPICGSYLRRFIAHGPRRPECECPVCGSLERHRLCWLFLRRRTDLFDGRPKRFLHVAPEYALGDILRRTPNLTYVSVDIADPTAVVRMDLTALAVGDAAFDVVCCEHVLEHIADDRQAMAELFRILKPGGWAIADVPILRERTFEDPTVTGPEERARVFGQSDHVRIYGRDFKERLESVGFSVQVEAFGHELGPGRRRYFGVFPDTTRSTCAASRSGRPLRRRAVDVPTCLDKTARGGDDASCSLLLASRGQERLLVGELT
jgi:SAM-dependent methyltransferase